MQPWAAERLASGRFRFTNTSGGTLALVVLQPIPVTEVEVEHVRGFHPYVVPSPVVDGDHFVAVVRGAGVWIKATAVPSLTDVYWQLHVS